MGLQGSNTQNKWDCKVVKHKTNEIAKQKNTKQMGWHSSKSQNKWDRKVVNQKENWNVKQ